MRLSKKGKIRIALAIFVICLVLLYFLIYVAPGISDVFVETYTAEYGTLDVDYEADCVFIRTERLYSADNAGTVTRVAQEGDLKNVSSNIVNVGGTAYFSGERGIAGYEYDGLEAAFTPETMMEVGPAALYPEQDENGETVYELKECISGEAAAGDPIYKIYDNQTWYLLTFLDRDTLKAVSSAGTVTVELPDDNKTRLKFRIQYVDTIEEESREVSGDASHADDQGASDSGDTRGPGGAAAAVKAIAEKAANPGISIDGHVITEPMKDVSSGAVIAIDQAGKDVSGEGEDQQEPEGEKLYRLILSCNRYYSDLGSARYGTVRIITAQKSGIILENDSIAEEDGRKGVYVLNKYGDYVFTPISIIGVVGDKTVVESGTFYDRETDTTYYTVNNYDSIKKRGGTEDVDKG